MFITIITGRLINDFAINISSTDDNQKRSLTYNTIYGLCNLVLSFLVQRWLVVTFLDDNERESISNKN